MQPAGIPHIQRPTLTRAHNGIGNDPALIAIRLAVEAIDATLQKPEYRTWSRYCKVREILSLPTPDSSPEPDAAQHSRQLSCRREAL
jgi:hypothetical protein